MTAFVNETLTPEQASALEVARGLAAAGIPVFVAPADISRTTGFALPMGWQQTAPDPDAVSTWRPGMALCAVMGCGLDLLDVDPRNGADLTALNGSTPDSYGVAQTPSGGLHSFIASLGAGSRDNVAPGIDVKGGLGDGSSRGFAFLPPTVKPSKVTGEPAAYRWVRPPDLARLATGQDTSGAALAARIRELRGTGSVTGRTTGSSAPEWYRAFLEQREPQSAAAATKAIEEKLTDVADWTASSPAGFRQTLMRAAMTLGGYVGGGWLDDAQARSRLDDAVTAAWGAPDEDDRRWIDQGLADGAQSPFSVYTPEDEALYGEAARVVDAQGEDEPAAWGDPTDTDEPPAGPPWNVRGVLAAGGWFDPAGETSDQGLAAAVAARMYPVLRYGSDAGVWVKRGPDVWEEAKGDEVADWVIGLMAELMPPGQTPVPSDTAERTEAHWQAVRRAQFMSSAGTGKIARKLRALVRSDHPATLDVADLDANPEVLWAGGVPWNLAASADVPTPAGWIDPNTPHLRSALCAPDPTVATPRFDAFLAAVMPDPELRAWALRVLSIALTGYADAAMPVLFGRERSGKSSLCEMLMGVLGSYGHAANPKLLAAGDTSEAYVYELKGRRLSFIDEGPKRGHDATERLKQLTGGASMTAARKFGNPVSFSPSHTLVMTTNTEPGLTDPALRARIRLIPCDQDEAVVRPARIALLGRGLRAEAPGILAALMREAAGYLADRDTAAMSAAPTSVLRLTGDLADEQDPVREWLETATVPCDPPGTKAGVLHRAFADWHQSHPVYRRSSVPSPQAFGRSLSDLGVPREHRRDGWYWQRSVVNGPGGPGGTPPTALSFMNGPVGPNTYGATPNAHSPSGGVTDVGGRDGSVTDLAGTPVTPEQRRSAVDSSTSVTVVTDFSSAKEENIYRGGNIYRGVGARESVTVTDDLADSTDTALTCDDGSESARDGTVTPPSTGPERPDSARIRLLTCENSSEAAKRAVSVTYGDEIADAEARLARRTPEADPDVEKRAAAAARNRELARLHETTGRPKTELRRQLTAARRERERLEAVTRVAGRRVGLPAVVDRAGRVTGLDLDTAVRVVRARLAANGGRLTVDVEHTGYPIGHADYELRSVQLGDAVAAVDLDPVAHADAIRALIAEAPVLHAHSATADLVPLAVAGLLGDDPAAGYDEAWTRMYDTVIPARLADPASTGSDPGLKKLSAAVLGAAAVTPAAETAREALFGAGKWLRNVEPATPPERSGWAQVDPGCETMIRYAGSDVLDTGALVAALPAPDPHVAERERLAQRMTARVTYRGVRIDREQVAKLTVEHQTGLEAARERIRAAGVQGAGSAVQVGEKLIALGAALPATPTGKPSVTASVLDGLKSAPGELGAFVGDVLTYRHHETALGLFLAPFAELCDSGDGRVRPTVYTLGTNTGRMATTRMNLQQLPREGGVRACITADPGQVIVSADFSSVELRVAAALSGDTALRHLIAEEDAGRGDGLHWQVARQVWGPQATKAHRYIAKRGVFGRLYGAGIPGVARAVGIDEATAAAVVAALDQVTPQLAAWSRELSDAVKRGLTSFPSYSGRVIHLPTDRPFASSNYAIQGSARELLVDALERWSQTRWGNATLIPVHDELLAFVPAEDGEAATAELLRCMTAELAGVPILAEADPPTFAWADST